MNKSTGTFLTILAIIVVLFFVVSWIMPTPIDWKPSYNTKDKVPLGLYVLDQEIDSLFKRPVQKIKKPVAEYLNDSIGNDSNRYNENILYINRYLDWDEKDTDKVLRFVKEGNTAFISAGSFSEGLLDSIHAQVNDTPARLNDWSSMDTSLTIRLSDSCDFFTQITENKGILGSYFTRYDTTNSLALGYLKSGRQDEVNFIRTALGKGYIFIHLEPAVFTNYFILQNQYYHYAEQALSAIPASQQIFWCLNDQTSKAISDSPLRFIKSQPPLLWAWYLTLACMLLFVIFNVRRSQRVIPILPAPANTSVEFAKTIGNLYFLEGDIRNVMNKKIVYLMERIRSEFHVETDILDNKFVHSLQAKSGKDPKVIERMIFLVNKHKDTDYNCSVDDLKRLNTAVEFFFK